METARPLVGSEKWKKLRKKIKIADDKEKQTKIEEEEQTTKTKRLRGERR